MQRPRFVFLAAPLPQATDGGPAEGIAWMLVSPNNRPLGRGTVYHEVYSACRQSVLDLRAQASRLSAVESTVEATGQWSWRVELDGVTVAVASRSYLRARECAYNLERFLEALPLAEIVPGTRSLRRGRAARPSDAVPPPAPTTARGMRGGGLRSVSPQARVGLAYRQPARSPREIWDVD